MLLDEAIPRWHHRERHAIRADAPPDQLLAAAEDLTWREVPAFRTLMGLRFGRWRTLPSDERVLDWFEREGFERIARTDDELVVVRVHPPRRSDPSRAAEASRHLTTFRRFADPGHVKIAFSFRSVDGQLRTETRVVSTDARSRRLFAAYWLVIRPGSGLIRRWWLRAIRLRAQRVAA
ncbi:MAG TPA: hypothetical protein VFO49_05295 [Nocardioides sp.]|nr:hypothetical protein [Nocardioides sp.]